MRTAEMKAIRNERIKNTCFLFIMVLVAEVLLLMAEEAWIEVFLDW